MKKELLVKNIEFQNDTYYYFDGERFLVNAEDCIRLEDERLILSKNRDKVFFLNVAFFIKGKKNITLDFGGATLYLTDIIQPFVIIDSKNITIKNVVVEYERSYVSEMTVVETGDNYFKAVINKNFPYEFVDGNIYAVGKNWKGRSLNTQPQFFQSFDGKTHKGTGLYLVAAGKDIWIDESLPWAKDTYRLAIDKDGEVLTFSGKTVPRYKVNDIVEFTSGDRKVSSIYAVCSKDIYVQNYRIINGLGMGFCPIHTENIYLDNFNLFYDEKSQGVVSNDADAIHAVACKGDFEIKNCRIEGMVDDALNIHSNFFVVNSADKNTVVLGNTSRMSGTLPVIDKGDEIAIYNGFTMEEKERFTVKKAVRENSKVTLTVDKEVKTAVNGDLVENISCQPNITIKNCKIGKANSHLRFQSRGKILMKDCECELLIMLTGDTNCWFESSPCKDITFDNVKFTDDAGTIVCEPVFNDTKKAPFYHENITIKNCEFTFPAPVLIRFADNIKFINNKNTLNKGLEIKLFNCGDNLTVDNPVKVTKSTERVVKAY